jgi:hypothetical protein
VWLPTPREIAERAAEVRARWSEAERLRRRGHVAAAPWTPPLIESTLLGDGLHDEA